MFHSLLEPFTRWLHNQPSWIIQGAGLFVLGLDNCNRDNFLCLHHIGASGSADHQLRRIPSNNTSLSGCQPGPQAMRQGGSRAFFLVQLLRSGLASNPPSTPGFYWVVSTGIDRLVHRALLEKSIPGVCFSSFRLGSWDASFTVEIAVLSRN